jgi:hypothetical protein
MRIIAGILGIFLFLLTVPANSQVKDKDLRGYLSGVTARGRVLYEYDQAAWHATDAFLALHPETNGLARYICVKSIVGWIVYFPKWNALHDHIQVMYEAVETREPGKFKATKYDPPREGPDDLIAKERALELAIDDFRPQGRPYNTAILPAESGTFYVYLYPGQTEDDVWPIGGDVRYRISPDGRSIIEKRLLHKSILEMKFDPQQKAVAGVHSHILSDVPEDTDVLYVLTRKPSVPEYIGAGKRVFVINTDGSIQIQKK